MPFVRSDAPTIKASQLRRYAQASQDLLKHKRQNTLELVLMLAAVLGLTAGGVFVFHLMR